MVVSAHIDEAEEDEVVDDTTDCVESPVLKKSTSQPSPFVKSDGRRIDLGYLGGSTADVSRLAAHDANRARLSAAGPPVGAV